MIIAQVYLSSFVDMLLNVVSARPPHARALLCAEASCALPRRPRRRRQRRSLCRRDTCGRPTIRALRVRPVPSAARAETIFERFESVRDGTRNTSRGSTRISAHRRQGCAGAAPHSAYRSLRVSNDPELDWTKTLANFDLLVMWVVNKPDWSRI